MPPKSKQTNKKFREIDLVQVRVVQNWAGPLSPGRASGHSSVTAPGIPGKFVQQKQQLQPGLRLRMGHLMAVAGLVLAGRPGALEPLRGAADRALREDLQ